MGSGGAVSAASPGSLTSMKLNVHVRIDYRLADVDHSFPVGVHDVPDDLAQIAMGAGWASPVVEEKAKAAPTNKARKAPENK